MRQDLLVLLVQLVRQDLLVLAELFKRAPSPAHAVRLMVGLEEAFRGRPMTGLPDELVAGIQAAGQAPLAFRLRQGEAAAIAEAVALIQNPKAAAEERLRYVRAFGEIRAPKAVPALLAVAEASRIFFGSSFNRASGVVSGNFFM